MQLSTLDWTVIALYGVTAITNRLNNAGAVAVRNNKAAIEQVGEITALIIVSGLAARHPIWWV